MLINREFKGDEALSAAGRGAAEVDQARPNWTERTLDAIARPSLRVAAAGCALAIAGVTLLAWTFRFDGVLRFGEPIELMRFNTALMLSLLAVTALTRETPLQAWSRLSIAAAGVLAGLTLLQWLLPGVISIDLLLLRDWTQPETSPGRQSAYAAVTALLLAAALLAGARSDQNVPAWGIAATSAALVIAIVALLGTVSRFPLPGVDGSNMAVRTALTVALIAVAGLAQLWSNDARPILQRRFEWLPVIAGSGTFVSGVVLFWVLVTSAIAAERAGTGLGQAADLHSTALAVLVLAAALSTAIFLAVRHATRAAIIAAQLAESQRHVFAEAEAAIQAGAALRASEERLRVTFENAAIGIAHVATDGRWLRVNDRLCEIVGYTREELLAKTFQEITHPDDLDPDLALMHRLLAGEIATYTREKRYLRKSGGTVTVNLTVSLIRKPHGAPYFISVSQDITDRKRAEDARRQSEAIKSAVLAAALDAIITIDHRGRVVDWNPAAEQMFGHSYADALGREMAALIMPPRLREAHRHGLERYLAGGEGPVLGRLVEMPAVRADGSEFLVELFIERILTEGPPLFTGFARDISERKRAEQELVEERAHLANLVESAAAAILTIDCGGRIESINSATEKLFEYSRAELIGRNVSVLMPEPYHGQHDTYLGSYYLGSYLRTGTKKIIGIGREVQGRRKDGMTFPIHLAVSEFTAKGQRYFTGIIHDMTERKRVEEALRESERRLAQAQKMEAVGQLSGGIAHDFNNLLTVIAGNLDLHSQCLRGDVDRRLLDDAKTALEMGAQLTERLLMFSRRRDLEPEVVNLNDQVIGTAELLRRTLGEIVDLNVILAPDAWLVRVDENELGNVILNLAINARDAMPQGGKLIIETRNVRLDGDEAVQLVAGDYVLLSVSDSGAGMPPDVVEHAFEPFFTTKEPGKGTGLGLASVYGFVKQSGGHAEIYSEVGRGTTVNVYLPRLSGQAEGRARGEAPIAPPFVAPAGATILVVEDNPLVRRLTILRVEALGFRVIEAESGPAAVRVLEAGERVALVFSDVIMAGGMSGFDLARWVSARSPEIGVVLTSGFAEAIARNKEGREHELTILRKPYSQSELVNALQQSLKVDLDRSSSTARSA